LRFLNVPLSSQQLLEKWLDEQMEKELPGTKEMLAIPGSDTVQ
jgi:hypothetical protein